MRFLRAVGCILASSVLVLATGCSGDLDTEPPGSAEAEGSLNDCTPVESVELLADQDTVVGEVQVCNDDDNLYVDFVTFGDWEIDETHLAISTDEPNGGDWEDWLTRTGNAKPGKFPYSSQVSYEILLDDLGASEGHELYIAAHAVVSLPGASGELVANGSFEQPVVDTSQGWDIFDDGTTDLGWSVAWTDEVEAIDDFGGLDRPETAHMELHRGGVGEIPENWSPYDGDQYTELDSDWDGPGGSVTGEPASVVISQEFDTRGFETCTLDYAWSPRPGHDDNAIEVRWNGDVVDSHSQSGVGNSSTSWTPETQIELAGGDENTLLEFEETGEPDSMGMFLDAVSVTCTRTETAWGANVKFAETMYLSEENTPSSGTSRIYEVELDDADDKAHLTQLVDLSEFPQAHIGHAVNDSILYAIDKESGKLGLYDIDASSLELKTIADAPAGIVLAATSPDGELYFASQNNDSLYRVDDVDSASPTAVLVGDTGINVNGADIAFRADGTLYLWTNAGSQRGLYTVDLTDGSASAVNTGSGLPNLTGLAVRAGGHGQLVGSEAESMNMHIIDPDTGAIVDTFTMQDEDGDHLHVFGDMTMGIFSKVVDFGTRFTERGSWATYFTYIVK